MPDVQMAEELPTFQAQMAQFRDRFSPEMAEWLERERPIDQRPTELPSWMDPGPREPRQDVWIKANGTLPDDPLLHVCVVVYASDLTILDTAMLPHGNSYREDEFQIASLDHAMWFHRPFRADELAAVPPAEPVRERRARASRRAPSSPATAGSRSR